LLKDVEGRGCGKNDVTMKYPEVNQDKLVFRYFAIQSRCKQGHILNTNKEF
jgi:hypothetical protein